jgi:sugar lactone lactonase YvrE
VIPLPDGFFPEGIAVGDGTDVYTGSLAGGAIWKGDLRDGSGEILVPPTAGGVAVGLKFDSSSGLLFVAGGPSGTASVYDGDTGATVAQLALGTGFVNDVVLTRSAAYFTNSFAPEIYEVALDARGRVDGPVRTIPLTGDFTFVPGAFNANGIVATADGGTLIVAGSAAAELYTVDPVTGTTTEIELDVPVSGDGLVLVGRTLFANENSLNRIAVIELAPDLSSGAVVEYLTAAAFDVPTTSAVFGSSLYSVNAKFSTPPTSSTPYEIVRVDRTR